MINSWLYSFTVWPDETASWSREVFTLFEYLTTRIELEFTEQEFNEFRLKLGSQDLTLREIERVPYSQPETVL